jgi:signal transduction histidine kinase
LLRSVSARIAAVTLVAAGGVIVIFTLFFVAERNLRSANNATTRAADVSSIGLTLRGTVTQLDSTFRAALRERNSTTLADWHRAAQAWHLPGARLAATVQRPGEVQQVHQIETLINEYVDDYGDPVLSIAQFSPSTAKSADVSEEGRLRIAQITRQIDSITSAAAHSAAARSRHADQFANRVTEAGLAALIITPLLLLLGGVALMRAVARPLGAVVSAASSVAAGDFEVHLDDDRRDEFGVLARAFNRMTSALKANREELVTRAQRLEESEQRKSELISIVSHEVRTPLASILGFARLLLERDLSPDEQRAYLRIIDDEATRLAALVSDFLDIRLLEDRRFPLRANQLDIRPIVVDQAERMLARHPDHKLEVAVGDEPVLVVGDEQRLTQVVINLLSNAQKFSPSDGRIRVGVDPTPTGVRVFVEDEGPGIPPEHADEVFEPFFRGDAAAAGIAGAGIGLALCRRIIEAHGGRIGFENLRPGARFWFELPLDGLVPEDDRLPDEAHV